MTVTPADAFAAPDAAWTVALGKENEAVSILAVEDADDASVALPFSPLPLPFPLPSCIVVGAAISGEGVRAAFGASAGVVAREGFVSGVPDVLTSRMADVTS